MSHATLGEASAASGGMFVRLHAVNMAATLISIDPEVRTGSVSYKDLMSSQLERNRRIVASRSTTPEHFSQALADYGADTGATYAAEADEVEVRKARRTDGRTDGRTDAPPPSVRSLPRDGGSE